MSAATLGIDAWLATQTREPPLRAAVAVGASIGVIGLLLTIMRSRRGGRVAVCVGLVVTVAAGSWIGANSPTESWFGAIVGRGSRSDRRVAITFDDGPNDTATLAIVRLLDARGLKATFFEVGKAVARRPDITRALVLDGQLVGNHSYRHDSVGWLDPRYPELRRTQRTLAAVGVCPAFYRPPHGQHTPLLARVVHAHSMVMVGWDVSAGDWASHDPQALAERIIGRVRPGSIIDLHDGLDGNVTADRSVVVQAMPLILDGLAARRLVPVRLDALLGRRGYLPSC